MLDSILKIPFSTLISFIHMLLDRPRLRVECGYNLIPNEDGEDIYLAFLMKVINPTKEIIYFERVEAVDANDKIFFPMLLGDEQPKEILPQRNIVLTIPCGHIVNTNPKLISIVDATERYHRLKGKRLSKAVAEIKEEAARLKAIGFEVSPKIKWFPAD